MSTLADAMFAWKAKLTTKMTPEQVLALRADINVFADDVRFLESENVKLRELVRAMFGGYKGVVEMLPSSYSKNVAESAVMDISDHMRELGIEVS